MKIKIRILFCLIVCFLSFTCSKSKYTFESILYEFVNLLNSAYTEGGIQTRGWTKIDNKIKYKDVNFYISQKTQELVEFVSLYGNVEIKKQAQDSAIITGISYAGFRFKYNEYFEVSYNDRIISCQNYIPNHKIYNKNNKTNIIFDLDSLQ